MCSMDSFITTHLQHILYSANVTLRIGSLGPVSSQWELATYHALTSLPFLKKS